MLKRLFLVAFAFGLFFLVLRQVDLHKSLLMLQQADLKLCLLAFLSFMAMVYLKGIRWSFLLKMQGHSYSVWNCFLIYMGTLTLGSVTPGRAGDFAKVFYLKQDLNIPIGRGITSVLVDRVFDLYLLLILGCLGLMTYPMPPNPALIHSVWAFFGLLILVSLLAFTIASSRITISRRAHVVDGFRIHAAENQPARRHSLAGLSLALLAITGCHRINEWRIRHRRRHFHPRLRATRRLRAPPPRNLHLEESRLRRFLRAE